MDDKNNQDYISDALEHVVKEQTDKLIKVIRDTADDKDKEASQQLYSKLYAKVKEEQIKGSQQDRELKEKYGKKAFWFVCIWSGLFWFVLLFNNYFIHLPDNVLKYLVIIIPVQVIGIIYLIIKGLFK